MGNRTAKTDNVTGSEGYSFDNANRLATRQVGSSSAVSYTSDANGNTLTDGDRTNAWDSQNRLISLIKSGKTSAFRYGADGLRRKMTVTTTGQSTPDNITHYGYDGSNVVREWEQNTAGVLNTSATYLMGPSGAMYRRPATAADVRWYVYDGLGSVVGEVDVNGVLTCEKKHDVFGLHRGTVGTQASRHGFVGGLGHYSDDETGLIYMRARYYDPAIGRFVSEDPAGDGGNWFAYCDNNPVNRVDESGNESRLVGNDEFMNTLLKQTEFRMLLNLLSIYAGRINTSITNPGGGIKVFTMMAANGWENMMLGYGMRDMRLALMGAGEMIAGAMGATIMVVLFIGFIYQGSLLGAMALDGEVGFAADVNYT